MKSDQPPTYKLIIVERMLDQNRNTQKNSIRKKRTLIEPYYEIFDSPGIFEPGTEKYIEYNINVDFKDEYSSGELFFEFQKSGEIDGFKSWLHKYKIAPHITKMKIEKGPEIWLSNMKMLILIGTGKEQVRYMPMDIMSESDCTIQPYVFEKGKMVSVQHEFDSMYALLVYEILEALRHGRDFLICEVCHKYFVRKLQQTGLHCPDCESASRRKGYRSNEEIALCTKRSRLKKLKLSDEEYNKRLYEYEKGRGLI